MKCVTFTTDCIHYIICGESDDKYFERGNFYIR